MKNPNKAVQCLPQRCEKITSSELDIHIKRLHRLSDRLRQAPGGFQHIREHIQELEEMLVCDVDPITSALYKDVCEST
jgi:hypothetical protein